MNSINKTWSGLPTSQTKPMITLVDDVMTTLMMM